MRISCANNARNWDQECKPCQRINIDDHSLELCSAFRNSPSLLLQLSIMLSRFSTLFVYLVAGLAVSAVATPMMGQHSGHGDGMKQMSKQNYASERPYTHQEGSSKKCNVGKQHCCNQVNEVISSRLSPFFGLFSKTSYRQPRKNMAIWLPFLASTRISWPIFS